jgi:hypothetical protein
LQALALALDDAEQAPCPPESLDHGLARVEGQVMLLAGLLEGGARRRPAERAPRRYL